MRFPDRPRRVAVTGLGVLAPGAVGVEAFWDALLRPAAAEPVRRVGEVDLSRWMPRRDARRLDRFAQLAVAAAGQALADAGFDDTLPLAGSGVDPWRAATVVGTGLGTAAAFEEAVRGLDARGPRGVPVLTAPKAMPGAASAAVSMTFGLCGPDEPLVTACAAGAHAIAHAARLVALGVCDLAVAGGAEACLTDTYLAAFRGMGALTRTGISRPFDVDRDGFAAGEGAGVLVLEPLDAAQARGARVHLEVLGTGSTSDAHHLTAPRTDGAGAVAAMRLALADAGLTPADVAQVNAHGTSTPLNDVTEARAVAEVLGAHRPPVTSVKGVTGHTLGAAGAVEAVAVALSVRHRLVPPTAGLVDVDPAVAATGVDVVRGEPRPWEPGPVLSTSFGFGGHNAALVLAPVSGS